MTMRTLLHMLILALAVTAASDLAQGQYYPSPGAEIGWSDKSPSSEMASLMDEIEAKSARKIRLEQESSGLGDRRRQAREDLRKRVRALYRISRMGALGFTGGFDAFIQHIARVKRLKRLVTASLAITNKLRTRGDTLREEMSRLRASMEKSRTRLAQLRQRAVLTGQQGVSTNPAFRHTFSNNGSGFREPDDNTFYGIRVVDEEPGSGLAGSDFASRRGELAMPIVGEFIVRDARREESDGPGLEFLAPAGTPVRAVAAGRVGFSDRYGSYGRIVILDHGNSYFTVYGGLGAVDVRVGDDLSRNARIGVISGNTAPTALFFEVRRGTRTLPPRQWLGL